MPCKQAYSPSFKHDIKEFKNNKPVRELIAALSIQVLENPGLGEPYLHNLAGLRKVTFGGRPQYRLIYRFYQCCYNAEIPAPCAFPVADIDDATCNGIVQFVFIKTREECNNLYGKGKSYFDASLLDGFELA